MWQGSAKFTCINHVCTFNLLTLFRVEMTINSVIARNWLSLYLLCIYLLVFPYIVTGVQEINNHSNFNVLFLL